MLTDVECVAQSECWQRQETGSVYQSQCGLWGQIKPLILLDNNVHESNNLSPDTLDKCKALPTLYVFLVLCHLETVSWKTIKSK